MKGHTGCIPITTTIAKAGNATKDIGITRITTTGTGGSMAMGTGIMIMTSMSMETATRRRRAPGDCYLSGNEAVDGLADLTLSRVRF